MYKLKQEYLTYLTCDNTDEDVYEALEDVAEDVGKGLRICMQTNDKGNGEAYIGNYFVMFREVGCYLQFKVYEEV